MKEKRNKLRYAFLTRRYVTTCLWSSKKREKNKKKKKNVICFRCGGGSGNFIVVVKVRLFYFCGYSSSFCLRRFVVVVFRW